MKHGGRAVMLAAALGCWLAGCGQTANEEGLGKGDPSLAKTEPVPQFRTQAEYELWKTEQNRKQKGQPPATNRARPASKTGRR